MSSEFIARRTYKTDHSSALAFVWSHIRRHPWVLLGMIAGAFSNAALASAVPYFTGRAVNAIINNLGLVIVANMALAIIGSQLARAVLQLLRNFSAETFAQ